MWGCCSKGLSQKLQKLQNHAARIITFSNYDRNTDELLNSLNWHKLEHQRAESKSTVNNRFFPHNEALSYNLRNTEGKLSIPQPRTNYCKRSFSYSGAVLWNSLPNEIKLSSTLNELSSKRISCFDRRCNKANRYILQKVFRDFN